MNLSFTDEAVSFESIIKSLVTDVSGLGAHCHNTPAEIVQVILKGRVMQDPEDSQAQDTIVSLVATTAERLALSKDDVLQMLLDGLQQPIA